MAEPIVVPTHLLPTWRTAKSNTLVDLDALFILRDDKPNFRGKSAPFVIVSEGEFMVAAKCLWPVGNEALQHLQCYRAPNLGLATLRAWLDAILESKEELASMDSLPGEGEADSVEEEEEREGGQTADEEVEIEEAESQENCPEVLQAVCPEVEVDEVAKVSVPRKTKKKQQRRAFLISWRYIFCSTNKDAGDCSRKERR